MIKYLKQKKLVKDVKYLKKKLLESLSVQFPDLIKNHKHYKISSTYGTTQKSITILYQVLDVADYKMNKKHSDKNFKIEGIEIFNSNQKKYMPFSLFIANNLIQGITIPIEPYIENHFDFNKINIKNIKIKSLDFKNSEINVLKKILSNLNKKEFDLLEFNDAFEIEVENKFYYTIFDMEDGNYLTINKSGKVFRLIHDHNQPVKEIFDNVEMLLIEYNGNKFELNKYFLD